LGKAGLSIAREHTVGDDPRLMRETFQEAYDRSDLVICAGGLGPTFDDLTRDVWSKVLRAPLKLQPALLRDIEEKFKARGIRMPPMNRRQAQVLKNAIVIPNPNGTAPGQWWRGKNKMVALLPGPARELYPMLENFLMPRLKNISKSVLTQKTFLIFGVPESRIDEVIRPWVARNAKINGCPITHGILASQSIISVKFTVQGKDRRHVDAAVGKLTADLRKILRDLPFGEDGDTLEGVIGKRLVERRETLAVAESCTGGLLSKIITDHAGASDFFVEGDVTYHNRSKMKRLGVKAKTLEKFGAVSRETASEMAAGLRKSAGADHALSITGIAGPTGGTVEKPVGLVYIGYAGPRRSLVKEFRFTGDRAWIRHRSALMALDLLRREINVRT
jgi:nicotinamide-nucleotide amidase